MDRYVLQSEHVRGEPRIYSIHDTRKPFQSLCWSALGPCMWTGTNGTRARKKLEKLNADSASPVNSENT